ncbi:putative component of NuA3 histone acetyltransferase complex [Coemansia guatemalensis]|uniref:Component of NuA3 histone acetyltransferase complex n=1 Tax=Coemansia guatemalensis TaxID=2761395 RepID=A0A9W8HXI5_9FUNG|nr:putative component of NuA3 histone acetyltransferase complex [Coemansia guatemalensis]
MAATDPATNVPEQNAVENNSENVDVRACFHPGLLDTVETLALSFANSQPYSHQRIAPFCAEPLLRGVREELQRLHYTAKETDILKYAQSGDLANLDGLGDAERSRLSSLQKLRDALYSQEFRAFVSEITGCGPLSGMRTDMSASRFGPGDHLLLHDDVIGDRRVSFIIYLADPDTEWSDSQGGRLELYPRAPGTWDPALRPTAHISPCWNQIVLFTVLPGQSHHAVEEVCAPGVERLSIQGWFHFPQPGEPGFHPDQTAALWAAGAESSLAQLDARSQRALRRTEPPVPYAGADAATGSPLTPADRRYLSRFLSPEYLDTEAVSQIAVRFADDSHVQLAQFLNRSTADALERALAAADAQDDVGADPRPRIPEHGTGEYGAWVAAGPPVVRRFLYLDTEADDIAGSAAADPATLLLALHELFASASFARWLAAITALVPTARRGLVRRFRCGLDYTLATPDVDVAVLDAVLCLARCPERWADGAVGGYHCYVDADPDDVSNDGSVCRRADDSDAALLSVPAAWNSLLLTLREPAVASFVKYISAAAPASRWDVCFSYHHAQDGSDDEEEQ